jgi:hypothetical protein
MTCWVSKGPIDRNPNLLSIYTDTALGYPSPRFGAPPAVLASLDCFSISIPVDLLFPRLCEALLLDLSL